MSNSVMTLRFCVFALLLLGCNTGGQVDPSLSVREEALTLAYQVPDLRYLTVKDPRLNGEPLTDSLLSLPEYQPLVRLLLLLDSASVSAMRYDDSSAVFTTGGWIDAEAGYLYAPREPAESVAQEFFPSDEISLTAVPSEPGWYEFVAD